MDRSRGTTVSLVSAVAKERALDPVPYYGVYTKLGRLEMKPLTIGHLAREAGINLETVRYYERRGLLHEVHPDIASSPLKLQGD